MTESTSHVERQVQQRIAAAKAKVQAAKERRDELSAARRRGLAARHANKLRLLAEQEQRAQQQRLDDGQTKASIDALVPQQRLGEPDDQDHDEPDCFR